MTGRKASINGNRPNQPWITVLLICLALAAITFAVFGQTLGDKFINFDDDDYVVKNPVVVQGLTWKGIVWAFTHVHASNWHPLTWLSHMLDCQLYGLNPAGHHLTSVLLHTLTVLALFLVLRRMTGALWRSAFVAAVFAIHPLRAESVAWVAERKDVLSGLFFILTLAAYVRYARRPRSRGRYALVMLLFALGLLCKPMLVTLPVVLLALDYWPLQRAEPARKLVLEKLPLALLSALSCVATVIAQSKAIKSVETFPLVSRIISALLACRIYLFQMVYPRGLAAYYPFPQNLSVWDGLMAGTLLAVVSAFAWGERQKRPWLLTGWVWYMVMLLPVIGIVQVGAQSHADRYTYLPQIGIYLALTWLAADWCAQLQAGRAAIGSAMAAVIAVLMVCAWKQTAYWKNSETLWKHTLACTTGNTVAELNLGHELFEQGRWDEVIAHYQAALQTEPDNAEFHNNLANALRQKGRPDDAMAEYEKAVQLKPAFAEAQFNLGKVLGQEGKWNEAIARYQTLLQSDPNFLPARINLGNALLQQDKAEQAATQFQLVLEARPNDAGVHLNLGLCLLQAGRMAEAKAQYEAALKIKPSDPGIQNNLAWLLATSPDATLRDGNRAVDLARQANGRTGGSNPIVLHTLAAALAEAGHYAEAIDTAQNASRLATRANPGLAAQLQAETELYQSGKPFHVPQPSRDK